MIDSTVRLPAVNYPGRTAGAVVRPPLKANYYWLLPSHSHRHGQNFAVCVRPKLHNIPADCTQQDDVTAASRQVRT
uniref:Uncharacterized protein n=1 Tax=candidate division WOR-3 bacterium TaxID=2052148 RepID=A0A7C4CBM4_UNCW3